MRKLGRIVRRVLTAVSLLLLAAVLAAWVAEYRHWELTVPQSRLWFIDLDDGAIGLSAFRYTRAHKETLPWFAIRDSNGKPIDAAYTKDGWTWWSTDETGVLLWQIWFPCWMAAIVFGALPSWRCFVWWRGVRGRRLASREGRCPVCGYDLRASPQRCPECGTAVGKKPHHGVTEDTEKTAENANIEH